MILQKAGMLTLPCILMQEQLGRAICRKGTAFSMKQHAKAIMLTACSCLLLAGCGVRKDTAAEQGARPAVTSVRAAVTTAADDHNALYESDDVHRNTDMTGPDAFERAETAVSDAVDKAKELMTDAKHELPDAAADMTETAR